MSDSPVNALLAAMVSVLLAEPSITALIGADGFRDRRLMRAAEPYLMFGEVTVNDLSTDGDGLIECLVSIQAWSSLSRRQVEMLAGQVRTVLSDAALTLTGAVLISLLPVKTVSRREAKTQLYVGEVQMRAVVTPA
ncbi:DUF3168 domain-containing protein [Allorhizobium sp. BGMRC 0089]|uniref:DUF3168 domain-containing protein n=1 Tax=Allorhizobium sonneratiae TaxID=2934936 RepID=UPI00203324B9|nr:DUF3168 domain-containing protein [Allorhizobium sonneratiae]MCM2291902.1 DUF3168 domain-containing protein [Allorhizobium sonneratiae]